MKQRGFILPSPLVLYGAAGVLIVIAGLSISLKVVMAQRDSCKAEYARFQAQTTALGEIAKKEKEATEAKHTKQFKETKNAFAKNVKSARSNAVAAFLLKHPGSGCLPGASQDTQGTNGTGQESISCDRGFIQDAADDVAKINSWQEWAKGIGFSVE